MQLNNVFTQGNTTFRNVALEKDEYQYDKLKVLRRVKKATSYIQ